MLFFEEARQRAEAEHAQNPTDAHVLTRWGGALLELAHFRQGVDAVEMIELAVTKFNDALKIDPKKHDALWCLGNALTSQASYSRRQRKRGNISTRRRAASKEQSRKNRRMRFIRKRWR